MSDAPLLLLKAARRLEPFELELARKTYLTAWRAAAMAGRLAGAGVLVEICRAAQALPPRPGALRPLDLLLDSTSQPDSHRMTSHPQLNDLAHPQN